MKRILLLLAIFLAGCSGETKVTPAPVPSVVPTESAGNSSSNLIIDYFPLRSNTSYVYESPQNSEIDQQIYITYVNGQRIQRRIGASKASATEVLQYQNGELRLIFGEPNFYFFEDLTTVEPMLDILILKEPLVLGQKWRFDEMGQSEITAVDVPIEIPMGAYSAIEVSTVFTDGRSQKEYYAEGIGLIKTVYPNKEGEQYEISLTGIVDSAALEVPIDLFIHDANLASYSKDERILTITTNCDLTAIINDELKVPASNGYVLLPNDISINRLEVNRAENAVIIDLNKALGAQSGDAQFLQNLADTLGQFFGATRAKITINGEFYDLDEYIDVTIEEDQVNTM